MGNIIEVDFTNKKDKVSDFGDKVHHIKHSLERINKLMTELRAINKERECQTKN